LHCHADCPIGSRPWVPWRLHKRFCHVRRLEYTNCADDADVILYTVEGGGHTWPGGKHLPESMIGRTTRNINATKSDVGVLRPASAWTELRREAIVSGATSRLVSGGK
jgi:hypothetical protein